MVWERRRTPGRAWKAGFLIGLGAAVKLVPLLMVLVLVPYAKSRREGARLVVAALATLALALGPLWIAGIDLHYVTEYAGVPGWGGLSLVLDPGLAWDDLTVGAVFFPSSELTQGLQDAARWITLGVLVVYAGFIFRYRPALIDAAVLLWVATFAFSPDFFLTYLVWGLPFFIMAGYLLEVATLQAILVIPTVAYYLSLWPSPEHGHRNCVCPAPVRPVALLHLRDNHPGDSDREASHFLRLWHRAAAGELFQCLVPRARIGTTHCRSMRPAGTAGHVNERVLPSRSRNRDRNLRVELSGANTGW